jgi:hypothetical protein
MDAQATQDCSERNASGGLFAGGMPKLKPAGQNNNLGMTVEHCLVFSPILCSPAAHNSESTSYTEA